MTNSHLFICGSSPGDKHNVETRQADNWDTQQTNYYHNTHSVQNSVKDIIYW